MIYPNTVEAMSESTNLFSPVRNIVELCISAYVAIAPRPKILISLAKISSERARVSDSLTDGDHDKITASQRLIYQSFHPSAPRAWNFVPSVLSHGTRKLYVL